MTRQSKEVLQSADSADRRLATIGCPDLTPVEEMHRNDWFSVRNRGGIFTVEHHFPQVVVLPVVRDHGFVMVRVKRPLLGDNTLELPAGACDEGESPEMGAARELAEETGIHVVPNRLIALPSLAVMPNRIPNRLYAYRVDLLSEEFEQRSPHDDEIDSVELVTFESVVDRIATGEIYVALPIAILATYLLTTVIPEGSMDER